MPGADKGGAGKPEGVKGVEALELDSPLSVRELITEVGITLPLADFIILPVVECKGPPGVEAVEWE